MIGTIRKHSKALWAVVITATIITFVYWGGQTGRRGSHGAGEGQYGTIDGRRITKDELLQAMREAKLHNFFRTGQWEDNNDQVTQQAYYRLLLAWKQKDLGVKVGSDAVAKSADQYLRMLNQGNPVPLDAFEKQVLEPQKMTAEDFERYIRHNIGNQQLLSLAGLGGQLTTPQEVRALYQRERQEVSAQAVFFSASNYLDKVTVTPEAVAAFYTNQMAVYHLPDRVQVAYVEFPKSNYVSEAGQEISEATDFAQQVDAAYQRMGGTNFFRGKTPEEGKETIRVQETNRLALMFARKKAYEFISELGAMPPGPDNLGKLAAQKELTPKISEPFDRQFPPDNLKVRAEFAREAFALTPPPDEQSIAGPIAGEDAAFVIAYHKRIPNMVPAFEDIQARVNEDYRTYNAALRARAAGGEFVTALTNALAQGKTFASVCVETGTRPVLLTPFSLTTQMIPEINDQDMMNRLKQAAFTAGPGKASDFVRTPDGGFVLFVQSKLPMDEGKMASDLPQFISEVRRMRESEAFNAWLGRESERANIPRPNAQRPGGMPEE